MRHAREAAVALALSGALAFGCASLIELKDLRPPDALLDAGDDVVDAGVPGDTGDASDGGVCTAVADGIANLVITPRGMRTTLDDTDVYFVRGDPPTNSGILRCSKCGCAKPTELVANLALPGGVAVDDRYVYWTDSPVAGSLNRIEKNDPTKKQTLKPIESPLGIAVDDEYVYWTVIGGGPNGVSTSGVFRAKKVDFSEVTRLVATETFPDGIIPYAIAVDANDVYFTTAPDLDDQNPEQPCSGSNGAISRVAKRGAALQTPAKVATGQACPLALALSDDAIYWVNLGAGTGLAGSVYRRPKSGGTAMMLADGQGRPTSISFFGGRITWSSPASQRLLGCTAPACTDIAPLANDQHNPSGVSADATGIYWVALGTVAENFGDGALRRTSPPR